MMVVPEGCAHGFLTLADKSTIFYFVSKPYDPVRERGVRWDDPAFAIAWPFAPSYFVRARSRAPRLRPGLARGRRLMRVLLTGVSSFTGCWFAEALADSGFDVLATCRKPVGDYAALERRRLAKAVAAGVSLAENVAFGSEGFRAVLKGKGPFGLLVTRRRRGQFPPTGLRRGGGAAE